MSDKTSNSASKFKKQLFMLLGIVLIVGVAVFFILKNNNTFKYTHNPLYNDKAMADVVENPDAVYGFSPSPSSTRLAEYVNYDWSDKKVVEEARLERIKYHKSLQTMYDMLDSLKNEGKTTEEIARAVSAERNRLRLAVYENNPEGLERVKKSNLETYGDENGPTADSLFQKYGSWDIVLQKAFSPNVGMDVCLGLYDEYYAFYEKLGII